MTDLSQLAKSLTKAQREAIATGHCTHEIAVSAEVEPLWFAITKHAPNDFGLALTSTGLAVRAELERIADD